MWILLLVIIGVIIFVIFNRSQQNSPGFGASKESPLDILRKRYAKGEIQKEDFERMKKDLEE
jgi:putative membrane protein